MGLGPGGQPIDANHLNKGIGMGNIGPAGKNYSVALIEDLWGSYYIVKIIDYWDNWTLSNSKRIKM